MAVTTTNLGIVTAYGYAKLKGYVGTEAAFAQDLFKYTKVARMAQNMPDLFAPEYSTSATYSRGDFCMFQELLYVCNTDISTPESWNSAHWDEISVTDAIGSLELTCTEVSDGNIVISFG